MGILEQKDIGLAFNISGTHHNTEINENGSLTLLKSGEDANGNPIYKTEGSWISDVINLGDKFTDYGKLFTDEIINESSSFAVLTRSSANSNEWSEWLAIAEDGSIQSPKEQYIQVKINLYAGFIEDTFMIKNTDFGGSDFVGFGDDIRLKREYEYDMSLDTTWLEEGSLHRKKITRDEWLRIDRLNVLRVVK